MSWKHRSSWPRRSASTSSSGSCATSGPSGSTTRARSRSSSSTATCPTSERSAEPMEPLLLYPDPPPPELAQALDLGGYPWKAVAGEADIERLEPEDGWAGAVICADTNAEGAFAVCRAVRKRDLPLEPLLMLVSGAQLGDLELRDDLFDDFCLSPFHPRELEARLKHLLWRT